MSVKFEGKEIKGSPFTSEVFGSDLFDPARSLYDAKVDGYSSATFHQKCDQVNGTVTLVILKNGGKVWGVQPKQLDWRLEECPDRFLVFADEWQGKCTTKVASSFVLSL